MGEQASGRRLLRDAAAIMERRERVLTLTLESGLTTRQIAEVLNVSFRTVEDDLRFIRKTWARQFTAGGKFDPAETIGDYVARFRRIYSLVMQNYQAGHGLTPDGRVKPMSVFEKMHALRTAMAAMIAERNTLQTCGLLPNQLGALTVQPHFDAREIAAMATAIAKMRGDAASSDFDVLDGELVPEGERRYLTEGE